MNKGSVDDGVVYHAGFPNAGEGQRINGSLSLDALIIKRRASTFFWRLESVIPELQWSAGSLVVVDRALPVKNGRLIVAVTQDGFTLCRVRSSALYLLDGKLAGNDTEVWGVVTYVIQEVA